jgi:manganese transport protein
LIAAVDELALDFIVLRSHGHRLLGDWFFGQTINSLRHAVHIPLLAVRE